MWKTCAAFSGVWYDNRMEKNAALRNKSRRIKWFTIGVPLLVWVVTTGISLTRNNEKVQQLYNTSETSLRILTVVISLPVLAIWLAVAFAAVSFTIYSLRISKAQEAHGYRYLAYGLYATLASFVASNLLNLWQPHFSDTGQLAGFTALRTYVSILFSLLFFWLFYRASVQLMRTLKKKEAPTSKLPVKIILSVSVLTALLTILIYQNPNRTTSSSDLINPTYGVSDVLIFFTIILPYAISWFFGLSALNNIRMYMQQVDGIIFKRLFRNFVQGISAVILLSIGLQFLSQFSESFVGSSLNFILLLVSLILLVLVVAYFKVAQAGKQLDRIETA